MSLQMGQNVKSWGLEMNQFDECHCIWCKILYPGVLKAVKSHENCPVMHSIILFFFQMVLKEINF